ncbi:MAG TPA: WecB/TagA/CpsF family glycosyltransferase [Verrucomicrobiae bacterium]|nr:WecB/TagA/CpsF family glycosyltransferase [Verrucomicrobiae bacterium]
MKLLNADAMVSAIFFVRKGSSMDRVSILGVEVDNVSLIEAVNRVEGLALGGTPSLVVTANPEIIWRARSDKSFAQCLEAAEMVTADGIGIIIAAKILGKPLKQRVTGIDLITAIFAGAEKKPFTFYFLGGRPGIAQKALENITARFPGVQVVGVHHGYFDDDAAILKDIKEKKPDILLAALGMGKQEKWIREKAMAAGVPVSIGVGGSFDVFSGEVKRAPVWMQKAGIEWLHRLIKQPSRLGRMLQLPKFLAAVIGSRLTGRNFRKNS